MVMLGQPLGTLTQALEQHLAVPHRAESEAQPAELGAEGIDPFRVEQRGEGAQVRAQLAGGDASLVNRLRVAAGADQGVVAKERGHRVGEHVLDHLTRRRVRQHLARRHLRRLERTRSQRPDVLGRGVGCARTGAAEPADQGI